MYECSRHLGKKLLIVEVDSDKRNKMRKLVKHTNYTTRMQPKANINVGDYK